jgi:hypothetical protein
VPNLAVIVRDSQALTPVRSALAQLLSRRAQLVAEAEPFNERLQRIDRTLADWRHQCGGAAHCGTARGRLPVQSERPAVLMAEPATVTLVYWHWPLGETASHRGWNGVPLPDVGHPMARFRCLVDCPAAIADEVVRLTPCCHRLDDERP